MSFDWTDRRLEFVKSEWVGGASAALIANELGTTRNSVIGKVHRLGLTRKHGGAPKPYLPRAAYIPIDRIVRIAKPSKPLASVAIPVRIGGISIVALQPGDCRFPLWTDHRTPIADKRFCGMPVLVGRSYCEACRPALVTTTRVAA